MPRSSGTYSAPSGTLATTATPISSSAYNAFVNDLVTDLNTARPITAGGTGATTAAAALANLGVNVAQLNSLSNDDRTINGAFDVWQRATTSTAAGYAAADRWRNDFTGGTVTQSRQAQAVGTLFGANNPAFFLRQGVTGQSLSTHYAATAQRIEDVRTYAGQTVTIMGWARRNSGTGNMAVEMRQSFGTGGSPSADVTGIGAAQVTLTGSWAPFAVTVAVTSVSTKTLGSDGNSFLEANFWTSAGSTFNARTASLGVQTLEVDLWGVHIRVGTFTTADAAAYVAPPVADTLRQCQRYFQSMRLMTRFRSNGAAEVGGNGFLLPVVMRAAPSATFLSNAYTTNVTSVSISNITASAFVFELTASAAGDTFRGDDYAFSAEL